MGVELNDAKIHIARRMQDIQPFQVMALLARARQLEAQGRSIIHMEIGESDFVTPEPILEAGKKAFSEGYTHYTPATGLPQLRAAIAGHYQARYGVDIAPQRIMITTGASGALLLVMGVLLNPQDQLLLADPGYPCNRHFARFVEAQAVGIPVDASTGYQLTADLVNQYWTERTVGVLLASPSNPTGTLVSKSALQDIHQVVRQKGGCLIVDEIYHGLVYGEQAATALSVADDVFVINSFSKYYHMTGWRLGWVVAPQAYVPELDKLAQNLYLAAPTPAQYAALAAFDPQTETILEQRRQAFEQRRDFLLPALRDLGFNIPVTPQGAFYLYADCSRFTDDSFTFATDLLEKAGVAITPGLDFGNNAPERHVRFAYTTSLEKLKEGVERIQAFLV
jgi:aspartate/methionine/tyrosine aminotransferase